METISITKLKSVNSLEKIEALNAVGIYSIRDMAEFDGSRHAELIIAYAKKEMLDELDVENYIEIEIDDAYLLTIEQASMKDLKTITDAFYEALHGAFGIETISDLSTLAPYVEARDVVKNNLLGQFHEKPSAPEELLPRMIGSTHTQVKFSNYVKESEKILNDFQLNYYPDDDEPSPATAIIEIFYQATTRFHLGYLGSVNQKWVNMGTHLGEPIHSIALAPGESRNIAVIDWYTRQQSSRREDTTVGEALKSEFLQTRALNEVVQATANEHLAGGTEIDASTKTTGYGLVGGMGGGNAQGQTSTASGSASLLGSFYGMLLGGTASGAMGNGMISSMAGSLGGSLVHSKGTVQGTLKSETSGERNVMGEVVQNITDTTVQNSSNVRSVMSTVVVDDRQAGRQRTQTKNITNYNHSHALTMQYYEVLQTYKVTTRVDTLMPVLFLPFKPINFNMEIIKEYWYLLKQPIKRNHPGRFFEWDQVVKDFDPDNDAFDATGDVRIDTIKITRTKKFTADVRVELTKADPSVTLAIKGKDLNNSLDLLFSGAATYVDYKVLEESPASFVKFGTVNSFEIDENITAQIRSNFKSSLVKAMKDYLNDNDKTPKNFEGNRDDNELGQGNNRDNLKQQVDDGDYKLLNGNEKVELTLSIEYELLDNNDQSLTVNQSLTVSFTFNELHSGMDLEISNVTDFINTHLTTVADINPTYVIDEIEGYFRFHKYGYTKYLLANIEKEQTIDLMEHLCLSAGADIIPLTTLIDPNPLGITENLLIFKLKDPEESSVTKVGERYNAVITSGVFEHVDRMGGNGFRKATVRNGRSAVMYQLSARQLQAGKAASKSLSHSSDITLYIDKQASPEGEHFVEGAIKLFTKERGITREKPVTISGKATNVGNNQLKISYTIDSIYGQVLQDQLQGDLDISLEYSPADINSITDLISDYHGIIEQYQEQMRARAEKRTVFLPTAGVFGEAILGISNASEYVNPRRFFNWIDSPIPSPAPDIQSVNANQSYAQPVSDSINPTVPVSVLNQISPQAMPVTSLGTALQAIQNGSMFNDMSKTEQLVGVLGTLADLANNTVQLSGNLAGDAAANSLNAAVALGQQVASMIGSAMGSNIASPPESATDKAIALAILDELSADPTPKEKAEAGVGGAQIPEENNTGGNDSGTGGNNGDGTGSGNGTGGSGTGNNTGEEEDGQGDGGDTGSGIPSGTTVTYNKVEVTVSSVNIQGGERFTNNVIELLTTFVNLVQIGTLPDWMAPEIFELFRPYSTMEVTGVMRLRDPNGIIVEQKNFVIRSTDALAILKNGESCVVNTFSPYSVDLINPIVSLNDLNGTQTITGFSNVDPVSVIDVLISTGLWQPSGFGLFGFDEINVGGWVFSIAEYSALVSNAVFGSNIYSQNVEYLTNLRESWTQSGLGIYINNRSLNKFDYINPTMVMEDICVGIPTSPPDIIIL